MSPVEIVRLRLVNQQLARRQLNTPDEIVCWMGAIQAQNYNMAKWAVGCRLNGSTDNQIEKAINDGKILRTHLLRPTWHLVSAADIYWMLELTAPKIKATLSHRWKQLELTEIVLQKSNRCIEKALETGAHLTRDDLKEVLTIAKISTNENRLSHLLMHAELDQLICSGSLNEKKQTYASLPLRVPEKKLLPKAESLARLAGIYFKSRGPATVYDFAWWSGLSVAEAKQGIEMVKHEFLSQTIESNTWWFKDPTSTTEMQKATVHLLPAFDEFIISYKNRTAMIALQEYAKAVSENGIFRPVILLNGKVAGTWKFMVKKEDIDLESDFFEPPSNSIKKGVEQKAEEFINFLSKE